MGSGSARALCLPLLLLGVAGCANEYPPERVPPFADRAASPALYEPLVEPEYAIQVGDQLTVNSYFDPSLKQQAVVQPDGRVSLVLVGSVVAAGRTPKQLGELLGRSYRRFLDNRDITVTVTEVSNQAVYVGGEVKAPTVLPIKGELTLFQAITAAGGLLPTANRSQVIVLRAGANGHFQAFQKDLDAVLRNEAGELYLRRRDIVFAPKSGIAKVDQFVDQYINQVVPRFVTTAFGYQFFNQVGNTSVVATPAR